MGGLQSTCGTPLTLGEAILDRHMFLNGPGYRTEQRPAQGSAQTHKE